MILDYREGSSPEEKNEYATTKCSCPEARKAQNKQLEIDRARERIERLFGVKSFEIGLDPLESETTRDLMYKVVDLLSSDLIKSVTIDIDSQTKAKISVNAKGKIEVSRSQAIKYKLEA